MIFIKYDSINQINNLKKRNYIIIWNLLILIRILVII